MPKLPSWIDENDLKSIFKLLQKDGQAQLVGGCVRDVLLGRKSEDIDIATTLAPQVVIKAFEAAKIKCIPTGIKHGTVTAILNDRHYEITTLRKDIETFGRHAKVEYTDNWKEDAARRDFTINAMYMDLEGKVTDYFNGQEDLKKKVVKFVGEPQIRIKEDYLRILRYFRFISYFGADHIDQKSLDACVANMEGIKELSGERIRVEMLRIGGAQYISEAFELLDRCGIAKMVYIGKLNEKFKKYKFTSDPYVNLAAMLRCDPAISKEYTKLQSRWRLSNKEGHLLHRLVLEESLEIGGDESYHKRQIYIHGKELYLKLLALANIEDPSEEKFKTLQTLVNTWEVPNFIINGEDLKKIGYNGPEIGKRLQSLHVMWIESNFELSKEQLLNRL